MPLNNPTPRDFLFANSFRISRLMCDAHRLQNAPFQAQYGMPAQDARTLVFRFREIVNDPEHSAEAMRLAGILALVFQRVR